MTKNNKISIVLNKEIKDLFGNYILSLNTTNGTFYKKDCKAIEV